MAKKARQGASRRSGTHEIERERRQRHAAEHDGERPERAERDLGEEERATPQNRERQQPDPDAPTHGATVASLSAGLYPAAASNRCLVSAGPSTDRTSKMPGDAVEPVSAARSGWATWPSFRPLPRRKRAERRIQCRLAVGLRPQRARRFRPSSALASGVELRRGLSSSDRQRPCGRRRRRLSASSTSVLARSFSAGHPRSMRCPAGRCRPCGRAGLDARHHLRQPLVIGLSRR